MRVSTEEWRVSGSMVSRASPPRRTREVVPHERLVTGSRSSLWGDWTPEAPESARRVSLLGLRRRERDAWAPAWGDGGPEWDPEKDKKKKRKFGSLACIFYLVFQFSPLTSALPGCLIRESLWVCVNEDLHPVFLKRMGSLNFVASHTEG